MNTTEPLPVLPTYEVLREIANTGKTHVYKGRHRKTGELVAIKFLSPGAASDPVEAKRFEQEFQAAARLIHPNIVRSVDHGDLHGLPYLVLEYVAGTSLETIIGRRGRLPEAEAVRIIEQIAAALDHAHQHDLIHRDVKPDNILINPDGAAKLTDFGLVKHLSTTVGLTSSGKGLGTPCFMAPEQFEDARNANARCDVYGLASTLYYAVTGQLPFRGKTRLQFLKVKVEGEVTPPRQLVPALSERLERAVLRAMSTDPSQRPASCAEFVAELTGRDAPARMPAPSSSVKAESKSRASLSLPSAPAEPGFPVSTVPARPVGTGYVISHRQPQAIPESADLDWRHWAFIVAATLATSVIAWFLMN